MQMQAGVPPRQITGWVTHEQEQEMPYLFVFLVGLNAVYLGFQLLKEKEPSVLPEFHIQQSEVYPETIQLVEK